MGHVPSGAIIFKIELALRYGRVLQVGASREEFVLLGIIFLNNTQKNQKNPEIQFNVA